MVKADGWIDWSQSALAIERQVRSMWDWPRAWTTLDNAPLQIQQVSVLPGTTKGVPGQAFLRPEGAVVVTGDGQLLVDIAQAAGGKPISGKQLLERAIGGSIVFGDQGAPELPLLPLIRPVAG